jgi:hypothetical protein
MKSTFIFLLLAFVATGNSAMAISTKPITTQSGKPVPAARIYRHELTLPSPAHTAKISFLRDAGMLLGACIYKILVDGEAVFGIRAGEYQVLYLAPGQHSFGLEITGAGFLGSHCPIFSTAHNTVLSDGTEETYRIFIPSLTSSPQVAIVDAKTGGSRGSWAGLQGHIENGRYSAPNGKVVFSAPNIEGDEHKVRDLYVAGIDRGFLEEKNLFGLQGVYYTSLAGIRISPPSDSNEHRAALTKGWTNFAMPNIFTSATQKAEVVHQEFIVDQGKEMLLTLVRLPELSGGFDFATKKQFDAYPAVLLLVDGGYVVVVRIQSNLEDAQSKDPKDRISSYLTGLHKLTSGLEVRQ